MMKNLPDNLEQTIFEQLYSAAEYVNLTQEEQRMYDEDLKRKWNNAAVLAGAEERGEERGIEKGIAQGKVEGKAEEKLEIAKNLKAMNVDVESISRATRLSIEEIEKL